MIRLVRSGPPLLYPSLVVLVHRAVWLLLALLWVLAAVSVVAPRLPPPRRAEEARVSRVGSRGRQYTEWSIRQE